MGSDRAQPRVPPWIDVAGAAVLVVMGLVLAVGNTLVLDDMIDSYEPPSMWAIFASIVPAVAPVAFRRVYPLGSLLVISVGMLLMAISNVFELSATNVAAFVALVSAGIYGRDSYRDWARGLFAVSVGAIFAALFISRSTLDSVSVTSRMALAIAAAELAANALFVGLGWFLGDLERRRREQADELASRNEQLQSALARLDGEAATRERLAIAREVHDIVGHTVSLLGIQAAAARRHLHRDPAAAETVLRSMEDQSRRTVDEISGLIAALRDPDQPAMTGSAAPTPGIDRLPELVDQVKAAGMDVRYSVTGSLPQTPAVGLSIYRVVQEALSNAIRHGGGDAEVVIAAADGNVRIFVSNSLADPSHQSTVHAEDRWRTGSGLSGMRERVGLHGGTLEAGRGRAGRFEVRAVLPVTGNDPVRHDPLRHDPVRLDGVTP